MADLPRSIKNQYCISMLPWVQCCSWGSRWLTGQTCHISGCLWPGWGPGGGAPHSRWWCEEGQQRTIQTHQAPDTGINRKMNLAQPIDQLLKQKQEVVWNLCYYLDGDEDESNDELGGWADEFWWSHRPLALFKDAVDAVGFGQHGRVSDGHAKAQQEAPECTNYHTWLRNHQEGDQVDQEDTCTGRQTIQFRFILMNLTAGQIIRNGINGNIDIRANLTLQEKKQKNKTV